MQKHQPATTQRWAGKGRKKSANYPRTTHPAETAEMLDREARDRAGYVGPARDGIEAQYGLNDTWPGDPYP